MMPAAGVCAGQGHHWCAAEPAGGNRLQPGVGAASARFFAGVRCRSSGKPADRCGLDGKFFCVVDPKLYYSKSSKY
ncbi:hypothetical protein [Pseudoramibacter faecis]|uniref:hypothetical protein n=1 Tax=Pseudoramibacter faecis TaxID=3108534 RepID=UPI002E79752B|nr:hypothetical protein [Pseudoramibacter sp. HA2172]